MSKDKTDTVPAPSAKTARGLRMIYSDGTTSFLNSEEWEVPEDIKQDPRWRVHTGLLVDPAVRFLRDVPWACEGLPCSPERLLRIRDRLGDVEAAQHAAQQQADRLARVAVHYRNQLTDWTGQIGTVATSRQADPALPKARRDEVRDAAAPMQSILDHYNDVKSAASRATTEQRQQTEDTALTLQRKDLEIRALRGDRLAPTDLQPPPAAPKAGRRRRR